MALPGTRQDAWTADDDLLLAEVTLRHIREGSTQLKAFEEAAQRLGRTPAACGFRWNNTVRKQYEEAIRMAKAQRQQLKKSRASREQREEGEAADSISYDAVIRFLRQQRQAVQEWQRRVKHLEKELQEKETVLKQLQDENERLRGELSNMRADFHAMNDDYKTLIQIMNRARKMALLQDGEAVEQKVFRMDENGNLERIE